MYWNTFKPYPIDVLLDREDITVEEVLDDKEVIQEIKSLNKKLTSFLLKPENFDKLIELVTVESDEKDNEDTMYKFPYVASEILCGDVRTIQDALTLPKNLDKLFKFLEQEKPSVLLATYFSRIINLLILKKFDKLLLYLEKNDEVLENLAKKVGVFPIMELLFRMAILEENVDSKCAEYLLTTDMYDTLLEEFLSSDDTDVIVNTSQLLLDLIPSHASRQTTLFAKLLKRDFFSKLLEFTLVDNREKMICGIDVLTQILDNYQYFISTAAEDAEEQLSSPENGSFLRDAANKEEIEMVDGIPAFAHEINERIPLMAKYLNNTDDMVSVTYSAGTLSPPLGVHRLKLVEFLLSTLRMRYGIIITSFQSEKIIPTLIDMFFKYDWNNFLHTVVTQVINVILEANSTELQEVLFCEKEGNLLVRILGQYEKYDSLPFRPGNLGHLTHIANNLIKASNFSDTVSDYLDGLPEWKNFQEGILESFNEIEQMTLGGPKPEMSAAEDSDLYGEGVYGDDMREDATLSGEFCIGFTDNFDYSGGNSTGGDIWNPDTFGDDDSDDDDDTDEALFDDDDTDDDDDDDFDDEAFEDFSPTMDPLNSDDMPPEIGFGDLIHVGDQTKEKEGSDNEDAAVAEGNEEDSDDDDVIESPDMGPEPTTAEDMPSNIKLIVDEAPDRENEVQQEVSPNGDDSKEENEDKNSNANEEEIPEIEKISEEDDKFTEQETKEENPNSKEEQPEEIKGKSSEEERIEEAGTPGLMKSDDA